MASRYRLVTALIARCPDIGDGAKITMQILFDYHERKKGFPPQHRFRDVRGKSLSNVQNEIAELKTHGLVTTIRESGNKMDYCVHFKRLFDLMGIARKSQAGILGGDKKVVNEVYEELMDPEYVTRTLEKRGGEDVRPRTPMARHLRREVNQYTAEDIRRHFTRMYKKYFKVPYHSVGKREEYVCREILKTFGAKRAVTIIDYALKRWRGLKLTDTAPTPRAILVHGQEILIRMKSTKRAADSKSTRRGAVKLKKEGVR